MDCWWGEGGGGEGEGYSWLCSVYWKPHHAMLLFVLPICWILTVKSENIRYTCVSSHKMYIRKGYLIAGI